MLNTEICLDSLKSTRLELSLRFADVDSMQVVHHTISLHWFEQLRFHFMRQILEVSMDSLLASKIAFPLTNCAVQYKHAIGLTDRIHGYTRVTVHSNATFTFQYWILTERRQNKPSVMGSTTHCYVNAEMALQIQPPQLFREATTRAVQRHPACVLLEGRA